MLDKWDLFLLGRICPAFSLTMPASLPTLPAMNTLDP